MILILHYRYFCTIFNTLRVNCGRHRRCFLTLLLYRNDLEHDFSLYDLNVFRFFFWFGFVIIHQGNQTAVNKQSKGFSMFDRLADGIFHEVFITSDGRRTGRFPNLPVIYCLLSQQNCHWFDGVLR